MSKNIYEVRLVPLSDHNAEGRWTTVEAAGMDFGRVIGDEYVVFYGIEQPFYQHGGHSTPEVSLD